MDARRIRQTMPILETNNIYVVSTICILIDKQPRDGLGSSPQGMKGVGCVRVGVCIYHVTYGPMDMQECDNQGTSAVCNIISYCFV
jgi:hypothetical protein